MTSMWARHTQFLRKFEPEFCQIWILLKIIHGDRRSYDLQHLHSSWRQIRSTAWVMSYDHKLRLQYNSFLNTQCITFLWIFSEKTTKTATWPMVWLSQMIWAIEKPYWPLAHREQEAAISGKAIEFGHMNTRCSLYFELQYSLSVYDVWDCHKHIKSSWEV